MRAAFVHTVLTKVLHFVIGLREPRPLTKLLEFHRWLATSGSGSDVARDCITVQPIAVRAVHGPRTENTEALSPSPQPHARRLKDSEGQYQRHSSGKGAMNRHNPRPGPSKKIRDQVPHGTPVKASKGMNRNPHGEKDAVKRETAKSDDRRSMTPYEDDSRRREDGGIHRNAPATRPTATYAQSAGDRTLVASGVAPRAETPVARQGASIIGQAPGATHRAGGGSQTMESFQFNVKQISDFNSLISRLLDNIKSLSEGVSEGNTGAQVHDADVSRCVTMHASNIEQLASCIMQRARAIQGGNMGR